MDISTLFLLKMNHGWKQIGHRPSCQLIQDRPPIFADRQRQRQTPAKTAIMSENRRIHLLLYFLNNSALSPPPK